MKSVFNGSNTETEMTKDEPGKACGCKHHMPVLDSPLASCKCKKLRTPRKIHAACGLLLAAFILVHLGMSVTGLNPKLYQQNVDRLHALPDLSGVALLVVLLPMLLQCVTGLFLVQREGLKYFTGKCDRGGRVRFFFQRWTALAILAFIVVHFMTLHAWGLHLLYQVSHWHALARYASGGLFQSANAYTSTVQGFTSLWSSASVAQGANTVAMFLLLGGIFAVAFHVGNGAWSGALLWKILPSPQSKRLWRTVCFLLSIFLTVSGFIAWYAFTLGAGALLSLATK